MLSPDSYVSKCDFQNKMAQVVNAWCMPICENNEVLQNSLSQLQIVSVDVISHKKIQNCKNIKHDIGRCFSIKNVSYVTQMYVMLKIKAMEKNMG